MHKITLLLKVADLARSTFYYHVKQLERADKYAAIKQEISIVYAENRKRIGYRRVTLELQILNLLSLE